MSSSVIDSPKKNDTTVGNYFVSNYPPFSFWTPEGVTDLHDAMHLAPDPRTPLGLYVHIPFCRKRCHFCYFRVYTDKDATAIRGYLQAAIKELDHYMKMPFIGGRKLSFVYFGGGTPSYLSPNQLRELTDGLKERLPWDDVEEVTFECEPGTLNEKKLEAIHEVGVTRLSLGVENFNDHILGINGRAHRSKEIEKAYHAARSIGFPQINIDLIAGMLEETESNWQFNIDKTLELKPDCVTIYQMEVPYNTTIYKEMKAQGKLVAPVADWETKRRWVREAFGRFESEGGYEVTSAYTAVRNKSRTTFIYRDRLWAGADLLSLGVASFGHIGGVHYQNQHDFEPYVQKILAGESPVYRALKPSAEEKLVREFILQLKLGTLYFQYFDEKFGVVSREVFSEPLNIISAWGYAVVDTEKVVLSRDGLLQVDRLLQEFFLPQHRNVRYA